MGTLKLYRCVSSEGVRVIVGVCVSISISIAQGIVALCAIIREAGDVF